MWAVGRWVWRRTIPRRIDILAARQQQAINARNDGCRPPLIMQGR
jgi:hypothetical protein